MPSWKELDLGEKIVGKVDRCAETGNGIIEFGKNHVNIGQVVEDAVGEEVVIEKSSEQCGVCLNTEFHTEDYLATHSSTSNDFYLNIGTDSEPKYREWIRKSDHPQPGDLFIAKIDRIGRNNAGIIDTRSGHDIIVEDVMQDDIGELIEARLVETRLAKKVSGDVEIADTLPSVEMDVDTIKASERGEEQEPLEEAGTDTSEEFTSLGKQTMSTHTSDSESQNTTHDYQTTGSETQTAEALREAARQDAVEQVQATTTIYQTAQYTRSEKIKEYAKARAEGVCEGCGDSAPFISKTGDPYLHAHHVHELSNGGSDMLETVIALCPNCHYRVHHGEEGEDYNEELIEKLADIEDVSVESIRSQGT